MSPVILDTDILSEYLKFRDPVVLTHIERYLSFHDALTVTSDTVHEITYGLMAKQAHSQCYGFATGCGAPFS